MKISEALQILDIDNNDTEINQAIIKKAYRIKIKEYHPDRNPAGGEMSKIINLAYEFLKTISSFEDITVRARKHKRHAHLQKCFSCSLILQIRKSLCSLYPQIRFPIPTLSANN